MTNFLLGVAGQHPRAKIEVHHVAFVVADTVEQAYPLLRDGWFGNPKAVHIDSRMAVDCVKGWRVELSRLAPLPGSPRLYRYLINLGGYGQHAFGEAHDCLLVVAKDQREAISKAKRRVLSHWTQAHTDVVMDVDDCLPIQGQQWARHLGWRSSTGLLLEPVAEFVSSLF
ncbi:MULTISPECIES: DUF1543 domain-containing protein [unclassified Pseudomonas]|uniref:DUF1543 domain-containing protein n=1 Tax=unclassified Pseudomonas TaxID=196821 RepID=UPI0025EED3E9|nr:MULTISPECIES: DUF1543 domain-containing protein [unclassified Pseudomonas]